jgi:hypothetical protein
MVIVTPAMHRVHHSRWQPETDSNYSAVLSIWDRLFGTWRTRPDPRTIATGLDGYSVRDTDSLTGMLRTPLGRIKSLPGEAPAAELTAEGAGAAGYCGAPGESVRRPREAVGAHRPARLIVQRTAHPG